MINQNLDNNELNNNDLEQIIQLKNNTVSDTRDARDINININVPSLENQHRVPNLNEISYPNYLHQKNHERIINPLLPPERSYENTYGIPINIPTRGSSGGFQQ